MTDFDNHFVAYHLATENNGDDYFAVGNSSYGKGLYSNVNIPAKTVLMTVPAPLIKNAVTLFAQSGFDGVITWRNTIMSNECHKVLYVNHSGTPNVSINTYGHLIALHYIFNGEELLFNYAGNPI